MDWVKLEGEERSRMSYRHEERLEANRGVKRPWAGFVFFFTLFYFEFFYFILFQSIFGRGTWWLCIRPTLGPRRMYRLSPNQLQVIVMDHIDDFRPSSGGRGELARNSTSRHIC